MQRLDRPTALDESPGQVIEKLGVAWRLATRPEVARSAHQTRTEVVHPDAVDQHASRQRVVRARDRTSQLQPAAALGEGTRIRGGEGLEELTWDGLAHHGRIAATEDAGIDRVGRLAEDQGLGRRDGRLEVPLVDLHLELGELDPRLLVEEGFDLGDLQRRNGGRRIRSVQDLADRLGIGVGQDRR